MHALTHKAARQEQPHKYHKSQSISSQKQIEWIGNPTEDHIEANRSFRRHLQLQVLDFWKQVLGCSLNVFSKLFLLVIIKFLRQILDKFLNLCKKLLLVKRRLLLKSSTKLFISFCPKNFSAQRKNQEKARTIQQTNSTQTHLEPKCVNDVNNLDSLVINTLIFTSFSWRICTNVYINGSLNNPLRTKSYNKNQQNPPTTTTEHPQFTHTQSKSQNQKLSIILTFPSTSHSIPFSISLYGNESERSSSPDKNYKQHTKPMVKSIQIIQDTTC